MAAADGRSAARSAIRIENLEELPSVFQDAFNAGDLDGLVSLYAPDAVFVPVRRKAAIGSASIREALADLLAVKGKFELDLKCRQQVGDIALGILEWKLQRSSLDGNPVRLDGLAAAVIHRQDDRHWLILIDNLFPFALAA